MKYILSILLSVHIAAMAFGTTKDSLDQSRVHFETSFSELKSMLEGSSAVNFERAVFISENPYWDNKYSYEDFQNEIGFHLFFVQALAEANDKSSEMDFDVKVNQDGRFNIDDIRYLPHEKKELYQKALKNWAIFTYMNDTTGVYPFYHPPFSYVVNDPFGMKDWANSQVLNMVFSGEQKGNCYALAAFYKILANRMRTEARICTAPQHIYIQHRDPQGDYYNVELATAGHPGDGIIQTLTYTPMEAIVSGIALREYNERQSIGLCLVNLAKAYEHRFGTKDDEFILRCAELALQHDRLNLNALLLKQQVLDERVIRYATENNITSISALRQDDSILITLMDLGVHLNMLHGFGYRQMPVDMQKMILTGHSGEAAPGWTMDKNPKPFTTIKPKNEADQRYVSLSGGVFQEVFEPKRLEHYRSFVFDTETRKITAIDISNREHFVIDPVAFAYDFGARAYDARLGRFKSTDPMEAKYPQWSPYNAFNGNPVYFVDPDGNEGIAAVKKNADGTGTVVIKATYFVEVGKNGFNKTQYTAMQAMNGTLNNQNYSITDEKSTYKGYNVQFELQFIPVNSDKLAQSFAVNEGVVEDQYAPTGFDVTYAGKNIGNSMILTPDNSFNSDPGVEKTARAFGGSPEDIKGITDASLQHINIPSRSSESTLTQMHEIFHTLYFDKDGAPKGIGSGKELPSSEDINIMVKGFEENKRVVE